MANSPTSTPSRPMARRWGSPASRQPGRDPQRRRRRPPPVSGSVGTRAGAAVPARVDLVVRVGVDRVGADRVGLARAVLARAGVLRVGAVVPVDRDRVVVAAFLATAFLAA